ncbi:hypothetical protein FHX52_3232 [Humibacillus xanthopallidus]|uniref:Uncharacterized protein n=1 Tax=Humibacillus xanthopallidus TaxID=412689 RepID=A0A543PR10_9MICO|nr:hypothetical protein [Humibacillus xanthopallidus]TQN46507.1 hypothetical protein FHX52_3232 [Humibacillus xanthopallidus]
MSSAQLDIAAGELHQAAALAQARSHDNPFARWSTLAGTLRLVAAGLHPLPAPIAQRANAGSHLEAALTELNSVAPDDAPADLDFWRAHILDLQRLVEELEAASGAHGGNRP